MQKPASRISKWFNQFSTITTKATGKPGAFILAFFTIIIWAVTGPIFKFSDTWQLVINTGTTIITFLMVFIIQQSQNKDTLALHLKLNELISASKYASNRVVNIEDLSPEELGVLKQFYCHISELAEKEKDVFTSHSVDEANENHQSKMKKKNVGTE